MVDKEKLIIDKIIYAKYLYQKGVTELSIGTDLSASVAILLFFDAVEMVVLAIEDKLEIDDKDIGFKSRIGKIKKELAQNSFPLERQILEINSARRNFKHGAQIQNIDNIKTLSAYAFGFMNQASDEFLGLDFQKISLSTLISDKRTKEYIEEAERHLKKNEHYKAIRDSAKAYSVLTIKGISNPIGGIFLNNSQKWNWSTNNLEKYMDDSLANDISQSFSELYHFVYTMLVGIDVQKYKKFSALTPSVSMNYKEEIFTNYPRSMENNEENSKENASFCIEFVTDIAIKNQ